MQRGKRVATPPLRRLDDPKGRVRMAEQRRREFPRHHLCLLLHTRHLGLAISRTLTLPQ
jgi:hypothetical protein